MRSGRSTLRAAFPVVATTSGCDPLTCSTTSPRRGPGGRRLRTETGCGAGEAGAAEIRTHNPSDGVYTTDGDWVHAVEVRGAERTVYVSGTMALDPSGAPGADLATQLELIWSNIRTVLAAADLTLDHIVRITSYLRDVAYAGANCDARLDALGGQAVATTVIVAQTLSKDWLVEIEAVAAG